MTKKLHFCLCLVFFAGAVSAAAEETRHAFAHGQASIAVPADVTITPSPGLPPNNELLNAIRGGRRILGIYAGNYPDTQSVGDQPATKETIGGYPALTYHPSGGKGRARQTYVQFREDGFPNVVHFFYSGVTDEEAGIADKMIESLQLNRTPTAQK
jgi:hypothetical protein